MKRPTVAICYDFDGTLAPLNMQEYGFFLSLPEEKRMTFWNESHELARKEGADPILCYMKKMIDDARWYGGAANLTREAFRRYGSGIKYFRGVETWFARTKEYAATKGIDLNHYLISSGLKEMVEGTSIGEFFKQIYACSFLYDKDGVATWPAQVVNYTTKTQYLFRINKGDEEVADSERVNSFLPEKDRPVPFDNMIYIGDGETDVPCMRLVKSLGGTSIAVYNPEVESPRVTADRLFREGRVNYVIPADYAADSLMDKVVKCIINKVALQAELDDAAQAAVPKVC